MKLDEARKLITEADALKDLRSWLGAKADNATSFPIPEAAFPFLVPLVSSRLVELAGHFEPEAPALTAPVEQKKRPKVRASVIEMWNSWATTPGNPEPLTEQAWRTWAAEKGFRWASVGNVLAELRAMSTPTAAPAAQPNEQ